MSPTPATKPKPTPKQAIELCARLMNRLADSRNDRYAAVLSFGGQEDGVARDWTPHDIQRALDKAHHELKLLDELRGRA